MFLHHCVHIHVPIPVYVHVHICLLLSPPIRGYLLDGKFFIAGILASTLTKLAIRYLNAVDEPSSRNVSHVHVYR